MYAALQVNLRREAGGVCWLINTFKKPRLEAGGVHICYFTLKVLQCATPTVSWDITLVI